MRWKAFTFMGLAALLALPAVLSAHRADVAGAVYTMTNAADGNEILILDRSAGGRLKWSDSVSTGGLGTGSGLGNQGAVILDRDNRWLFAVNAGSNEISVFRVLKRGLALVDTVASGGIRPVSLTVDRDLLYVLNAGSDEISGFSIGHHGRLTPIADSTRPLSGTGTGPAQVEFSPNGRVLVVTEKATNKIDTYVVEGTGWPPAHGYTIPKVPPRLGSLSASAAFSSCPRLRAALRTPALCLLISFLVKASSKRSVRRSTRPRRRPAGS